jgi:hypothetical protein
MQRLLPAVLILLMGCNAELPKDKVELFAAVAFITWGMEEGNNKFGAEQVDRKISSDTVEYIVPPSNMDGMNMYVKSPRDCVFEITTSPPKGQPHGMSQTIDFNKATSLELNFMDRQELTFPMIYVEGPQVYCDRDKCEDEKGFMVLEFRGDMDIDTKKALALRKTRAINLIKQSCPGKPF